MLGGFPVRLRVHINAELPAFRTKRTLALSLLALLIGEFLALRWSASPIFQFESWLGRQGLMQALMVVAAVVVGLVPLIWWRVYASKKAGRGATTASPNPGTARWQRTARNGGSFQGR